ncbi:hypothetical protein NHX12_023208, partial [Muraenolepis orangiensis]
MNTAGGVCLSVLSSFLAVAGALAATSALALVRLSAPATATDSGAEGSLSSSGAASSSPCSSLVAGVLYGSFSLRELFPSRLPGCSWSLENPDPTKYSLYLRFTRHPSICRTHYPVLLSLDHHLANQSCLPRPHADPARDREAVDLCGYGGGSGGSEAPFAFLQFDKNFVQLCLSRHPAPDQPPLAKEILELRLVEVLLINNENSSQFTCGVLCRWLEECLRGGRHGGESQEDHRDDGCGVTQTGCVCPNHNMAAVPPAIPLLPATPHDAATGEGSPGPDACCVTEQNSNVAIAIAPRDVRQGDITGKGRATRGQGRGELPGVREGESYQGSGKGRASRGQGRGELPGVREGESYQGSGKGRATRGQGRGELPGVREGESYQGSGKGRATRGQGRGELPGVREGESYQGSEQPGHATMQMSVSILRSTSALCFVGKGGGAPVGEGVKGRAGCCRTNIFSSWKVLEARASEPRDQSES